MLKIAIVEDEYCFAQQISGYIYRLGREQGYAFEISRFSDGEDFVTDYSGEYDVIFMDIQMPHMDGMRAAELIRKIDSEVILIFVTNMIQYAVRGYEVDAMDYIVKPIEYFSFSKKLERALQRVHREERRHIVLQNESGIWKVDINDVYYIESQKHYLCYHTNEGNFSARGTMQEAEAMLEDYHFYRINKGCVVNMRHISGMKDGDCVIDSIVLPISRSRKKIFMERLLQYIGDR